VKLSKHVRVFFFIKKLLASLPSNFDLSDDAFLAVEARGLVSHVPASGQGPLSLRISKLINSHWCFVLEFDHGFHSNWMLKN